jgi:hypothetical protein
MLVAYTASMSQELLAGGGDMRGPYCGIENPGGESYCERCGGFMHLPATTTSERNLDTRSLVSGSSLQGGRYVIKKILGQGGMGSVFLAMDVRLSYALVKEVHQRYQSAQAMKHDIDTLLFEYSGMPGNKSSYIVEDFMPVAADVGLIRASRQMQLQQQLQVYPALQPVHRSHVAPYQPLDRHAGLRRYNSDVRATFVLFVLCMFLLVILAYVAISFMF